MIRKVTPEIEAVAQAIAALNGALEAIWGVSEPVSIEEATEVWLEVQDQIRRFRDFEASLEQLIVNLMPAKQHATIYGRLEQVTSANKTTWDTALLMPKLAQAALAQNQANEDGEPENAVEAITRAVLDCASVSYFRLGKLEGYGIDGKNYRDVEWGRKRIKITPVTGPITPKE